MIAALQRAAPPGTQGLTQGSLAALTFLGNLAPLALGAAVASGWQGERACMHAHRFRVGAHRA